MKIIVLKVCCLIRWTIKFVVTTVTKQFSRFDDEQCVLLFILMFHIQNCKQTNLNPFLRNVRIFFLLSSMFIFAIK
jgi:hypothetical protein